MPDIKKLSTDFIVPAYPPGTVTQFNSIDDDGSENCFLAKLPVGGGIEHSIIWYRGAYSNVGRGTWTLGAQPTVETAWFDSDGMFNPGDRESYPDVQAHQTINDILETISLVISPENA